MAKWSCPLEKLVMNAQFWNGKVVLITGHTGFKGSWLSLWLQSVGANVIGFSLNPPSEPNLFSIVQIYKDIQHIHGDIRDLDHLKQVFKQHQPHIVFHMAAQSLVQYSYKNPVDTYTTNVLGTLNILEASRESKVAKVIINVTSDKCYENKEQNTSFREGDPLGGYDPYSNSKACADLIASAYRQSFDLPIASVRAGNVIGGGDWADNRLIPDIMRAYTQQKQVKIRHVNAIRPWQHVLEPLDGYLTLAEKLWDKPVDYIGDWNFGPNEQDIRPVKFIVDHLTKLWQENSSWIQDTNSYDHEAQILQLNINKAKTQLNWAPKLSIEQTLEHVVSWYKAWRDEFDMRAHTLKQIQEYMELTT